MKTLIKVAHVISNLQQWVILTHTFRVIQAKSHIHANFVASLFQLIALIEGSFSHLWPWAKGPMPQIVKSNSMSTLKNRLRRFCRRCRCHCRHRCLYHHRCHLHQCRKHHRHRCHGIYFFSCIIKWGKALTNHR